MEFTIPVVDVEVDTDDLGESATNVSGAFVGLLGLFGLAGAATYAYQRLKSVAGVEGDTTPLEGI